MTTRGDDKFEIRLKNSGGVPILQLGGTITKTAFAAIRFTLEKLASAGHYHVVLNLERANVPNWHIFDGLAGAVRNIKSHYGSVDMVVTRDRLQQLSGMDQLARLFRFCASEGQAISRIKGLLRQPDGNTETNARILEKPR